MRIEECKPGLVVRFRSWKSMKKEYGVTGNGIIYGPNGHRATCFKQRMSRMYGTWGIIRHVGPDYVTLYVNERGVLVRDIGGYAPWMLETVDTSDPEAPMILRCPFAHAEGEASAMEKRK